MSYNFENLSPLDFEKLSIDLLQEHFKVPLIETFKPGKDYGIDGRFIKNNGIEIIIQCKHYKNFSDLKANLKKENEKIENLKDKTQTLFNYILVTSLGLTPNNKDTIRDIIPYINNTANIFGRDELNSLFKKFPEVEKRHFKLWINSSAVLEKFLNNDVYNRSSFEIISIKKKMKLYVETENLKLVYEKLKENNFCIISGIPGVGKTTLAEMLILEYLRQGYDLIVISRDMTEALKTYSPKKKIVFYYDDFLGTTFLKEALPKNEDSDLIKFINNIKEDRNKKFIFTTREYILNQAIERYEKIKDSEILSSKFVIELKEYTYHHKAEILFNHLYFSKTDIKYVENLKETKKYRDIVRHKNFNPRLIEWMCRERNLKGILHSQYSDWCIKNLENPEKIWEDAFKNISNHSKALCYLIAISKQTSQYIKIKEDFDRFYENYCDKYNLSIVSSPFEKSIKEIEDSFISLKKQSTDSINIELINPSVNDFIESLMKNDKTLVKNLIKISLYIYQIQNILDIVKSKNQNEFLNLLEDKEIQILILELTQEEKESHRIFSFILSSLPNAFLNNNKDFLKRFLINFINKLKSPIIKKDISFYECLKCLDILEANKNLYFGKRETILQKAKQAFCEDIDGSDFALVKEFMDKFSSIIDENTKNRVTSEAFQIIDEWYYDAPSSDPEEIRSFADSIEEVENAFGFDNEKSKELYERAEELEIEIEENENNDSFFNDQNIKKEDNISNHKLDEMFNKL